MIEQITPLIITYNEAPNIGRTLDMLRWARRIVVIDSGSTDGTLEILHSYTNTEATIRSFDSFAEQCNFGLQNVDTKWVLSLDADYELSGDLVTELERLRPVSATGGYQARFIYRVAGRALRGSLYPPRVVLYRREGARYYNAGHGHRVNVVGAIVPLRAPIYHDDRKPLSRWFTSQRDYARKEADYLLKADRATMSLPDRIRLAAWPAPMLVFFYTLLLKGCFRDGLAGWQYVLQRVLAELVLALEIIDRRLSRSP